MNRRDFIKAAGLAAGTLLTTGRCQRLTASETSPQKPNVLFILADDLGWADLGCYGSAFYETPNLDRLATQGMRFTDAYAACPVCSPTRASIMTGKYPSRLDTTDWFGAPQPDTAQQHWTRHKPLLPARYRDYLPHEEVTPAEALKKVADYTTFFAGKWHLGEAEAYWPEHHGFDINKGGHNRGGPYGGKQYFSPYGNPRLEDGPDGEYLPLRLAEETAQFIEASQTKPFLAFLSFYKVHTPLMTTQELEEKYKKKREQMGLKPEWGQEGDRRVRLVQEHAVYAGMIEAMDTAVGIVLAKLAELGLDDRTIVFFTSDNGGLSTSEGHPTSNLPLRAGKGWLYEGGIRVPLIIKWPGVTRSGSVCSEPVTSTDYYPTILEMTGLPLRADQHCDGKSLVPLIKENRMTRGPIFWHYPHYGNQGGSPGAAVREGDWKLIEFFETNTLELYHLREDIGESRNLADLYPDKTNALFQKLRAFRRETDAKMPSANPASLSD